MSTIVFLACETTLPGSAQRRADAFEHDLMVAALAPAMEARGIAMKVIDWEADLAEFAGVSLALLGSCWNYQDKHEAFLARLDELEAQGVQLCNSAEIVRWNSRKTYLRELSERGAATIPTLWREEVTVKGAREALDTFETDRIVVKRQIGAGAEGQELVVRSSLPGADWSFGHPAMLQPYLPAIAEDGELSLIFIDGAFSHALRKRAADGEYRIQSIYGGREEDYAPSPEEIAQAQAVFDALPFDAPLYARIDMLRHEDQLLLMEAEMIEPYLYPEQGPQLGEDLAKGIAKRLQL